MATTPVYPATTNQQAIALNIFNAEQFHQIVNGDISTTVETFEGNGNIPSVAKALYDAVAYKEPVAWVNGDTELDLVQPRLYLDNVYVPLYVPAPMGASPDSSVWRLWLPKNKVVIYREKQTGADIVSDVSTLTTMEYAVGENDLRIYVDRAVAIEGVDYNETSSTSVTWLTAVDPSAQIVFEAGDTATGQVDTATFIALVAEAETARDEAEAAQTAAEAVVDQVKTFTIKSVSTPYTIIAADLDDNYPTILVFDDAGACVLNVPDGLAVGSNINFRNKQGGAITVTPTGSSAIEGAGTVTNNSTKISTLYIEDASTIVTIGDFA